MIKPTLCNGVYVAKNPCRCHLEPGHEGDCGDGGEVGTLRWYLHNVGEADPLRSHAESRWRELMKDGCEHVTVINSVCAVCGVRPVID